MSIGETSEYAVELEGITKRFGSFTANENITLRIRKGEIHALLGENGAGKSTLMNALFGLIKPDEGTIKVNGKPVTINNPHDATAYGIGMVHQHFKQVECFTVLQNIVLGVEDAKRGILRFDAARERIGALCEQYKFDIDLDALVSDISVGMQQRVEILKMLYRENDVLIFDEPTAVLTPQEIEGLLDLMRTLAASGKSILFITHKLNEIRAVADRCTVLRKGRFIETFEVAGATPEEMSERMTGRKVRLTVDKAPVQAKEVVLSVEKLHVRLPEARKDAVNGVSFSVRAGEIVCIAGIDGNGQSQLVAALAGLLPVSSGKILLDGKEVTAQGARERTLSGVGHVPENRLKHALVPGATLAENMILQSYYTDKFQRKGFLQFSDIRDFTLEKMEEFDISAGGGPEVLAGGLSGGNQQKLVIARELARSPRLFIAAQPIRGLDVGAIEFIHDQLLRLREEGEAILMLSFELSEVLNVSDRILVMFEGQIVADLAPQETSAQELGLYMAGAKRQEGLRHEDA